MKSKQQITFRREDTGTYYIWFTDNNGRSILAKTKHLKTAVSKASKFAKRLEEGILLRAEKSVYKLK